MFVYEVLDVLDPRTDVELARDAVTADVSSITYEIAMHYMRSSEVDEWVEHLTNGVRAALYDAVKDKTP